MGKLDSMKRINFYLDDNYYDYLRKLPGSLSENIRIAIIEFITDLRALEVSASESKRKEEYGRTNKE